MTTFTTKYGDKVDLQSVLDALNGALGTQNVAEYYRGGLEAAREVLETLVGPDERCQDGEEVI